MGYNSPQEILNIVSTLAIKKASYKNNKTFVLAIMAGAYIAFGGLLSIIVGGGVPGLAAQNPGIPKFLAGSVFPFGLMLVVLTGAELFTGNNAYFIPNVLDRKQKLGVPLKNWLLVYLGNFVGALFVAYFITHLTGVVDGDSWNNAVFSIAESKTGNPFYKTFLKGIGANWLVCLSLWLGMSAKDAGGKMLGIWWPVMAFVTIGFEHSIANMFFIPLAIFQGADITWELFFVSNLIPATLGNIVGGSLFVGAAYWYTR